MSKIYAYEEAAIEVQDDAGEWNKVHYYSARQSWEAGSPLAAAREWFPKVNAVNKRIVKLVVTVTTEEVVL